MPVMAINQPDVTVGSTCFVLFFSRGHVSRWQIILRTHKVEGSGGVGDDDGEVMGLRRTQDDGESDCGSWWKSAHIVRATCTGQNTFDYQNDLGNCDRRGQHIPQQQDGFQPSWNGMVTMFRGDEENYGIINKTLEYLCTLFVHL